MNKLIKGIIKKDILVPVASIQSNVSSSVHFTSRSAVMITLCSISGDPGFVYAKRSDYGVHGGQVCFPGGRMEANENAVDAALREMEEEVKFPQEKVEILGILDGRFLSVTKSLVTPVVGYLGEVTVKNSSGESSDFSSSFSDFVPDGKEVVDVFGVTFDDLRSEGCMSWEQSWRGISTPRFSLSNGRPAIWGLTALITYRFCRDVLSWDFLPLHRL